MKLKDQVDTLQKKADKAEGALDTLLKELQRDFECSTLEEARKKLVALKRKSEQAKTRFEKQLSLFEEKWGDGLQQED